MLFSRKIWLGASLALIVFGGWHTTQHSGVRHETAPVLAMGLHQAGHPVAGAFNAQGESARQRELAERLASERPEGVEQRPLTIKLTATEAKQLGSSEPGTRKLRVGVARSLDAQVRFDDLSPSDLRRPVQRPYGVVESTPDGGFVWTALIRSEGATALRVRLNSFFLPPGAELWIYTQAGEAFGPYVRSGPDGNSDFWTHSVSGSEAFLQLRKQGPVTQRDLRTIRFVVAEVAHIDRSAAGRGGGSPDVNVLAGFCSYNASCVVGGECAGNEWEDVRHAIAQIEFVSFPFVYICSGGLVADSDSSSAIPYFLTANHCISRSREANSVEAFFQYRSSGCNSQTNCDGPSASTPRTLGSSILSTNTTSDYTLLRLSEPAPAGSFFLGWNATPVANQNATALYRFSHPKGAPQAYSSHVVDTSRPTCSSWPRGPWIYSVDVEGATEGGSSGSPVLNGAKQIVGQLSGGCGFNVNDVCDSASNATVDGAFANYYNAVASYLGPATSNQPPTAAFTYQCADLQCTFDATSSSDGDGSISSYSWTFGDGNNGSGATPSHTYATANTYTVMLTVTDDDGATGSTSQSVTVSSDTTTPGITLTASGYKVKGLQKADLLWSGATSTNVDIYRDGAVIATTSNDGAYTDNIDRRGGGSYTYRVCESGTSTCSSVVTVTF